MFFSSVIKWSEWYAKKDLEGEAKEQAKVPFKFLRVLLIPLQVPFASIGLSDLYHIAMWMHYVFSAAVTWIRGIVPIINKAPGVGLFGGGLLVVLGALQTYTVALLAAGVVPYNSLPGSFWYRIGFVPSALALVLTAFHDVLAGDVEVLRAKKNPEPLVQKKLKFREAVQVCAYLADGIAFISTAVSAVNYFGFTIPTPPGAN